MLRSIIRIADALNTIQPLNQRYAQLVDAFRFLAILFALRVCEAVTVSASCAAGYPRRRYCSLLPGNFVAVPTHEPRMTNLARDLDRNHFNKKQKQT